MYFVPFGRILSIPLLLENFFQICHFFTINY